MTNALVIEPEDNVAVVIEEVSSGEDLIFLGPDGEEISLKAQNDIPIYHKFALKDIKKGEPIVKYAQHIGLAGCDIRAGEHVHTHNVEDHREI